MPAPATNEQFLELVRKSGLVEEKALAAFTASPGTPPPANPKELARALIREGLLTRFQADQLVAGKSKGFVLAGKYKLLEHLGSGGMGSVYLCEHISMRRQVAIKVLPLAHANDPSYLERFYREARAVAALDHPNIVRAHDIDRDGKLHFLVMEYVDGSSLQDVVSRFGPLEPLRAAHYMSQAAWGLQHAHEAGLVHRDIKPGNLIVDRTGTVKLLDMGLARFFHDNDDNLSKRFDETVLGTSDYLAPEQTLDSNVDIRADIYSLGATFYYCLTGQTLFGEGKVAQKLIWHQTRQPKPIRSLRPEVPETLAELLEQKMLAKDPAARFQVPVEICHALAPLTQEPLPPPPEEHMPRLCPAVARGRPADVKGSTPPSGVSGTPSPGPARGWTVSGTAVVRAGTPPPRAHAEMPTPQPAAAAETPRTMKGKLEGDGSSGGSRKRRVEQAAETVDAPAPAEAPTRRRRRRAAARRPAWPVWAALVLSVLALGAGGTWVGVATGFLRLGGETAQRKPTGPLGPPGKGEQFRAGPVVAPAADGVIRQDRDGYRVRTPAYEAVVGTDGNLSSFRVGGVEFLKTGLHFGPHVSRGSYFFLENDKEKVGVVKLPTIERSGKSSLKAVGDRFSVVYDFGPDSLSLKLNNATDYTLPFFLIFDPEVNAVANEQGEVASLPAKKDWKTTSWLSGRAKVTVTGGDAIWGPFEGRTEVWQVNLTDYATRTAVLTAGKATEAEAARAAEAAAAGSARQVRKAGYETTVGDDGCLTSLRVGGVEFFRPGVDVSRGLYLHDGQLVRLPDIDQKGDVITAKGDKGSLRYEFGAASITCTAENKQDRPVAFFIVFDPAVSAVRDGQGEWHKTVAEGPADKRWETTTWFADDAKLIVNGGNRVWGPWSDLKLQVWEASLAPKETRKVEFWAGPAADAELKKVAEVTGRPAGAAGLVVQSPADYEVFQRKSRTEGPVRVRGRVRADCDRVEVRLTGSSLEGPLPDRWQAVAVDPKARTFDQVLPAKAGGWYKAEVRALKGDKAVAQAAVEHVGVGEVFVGSGQSNSTNCGDTKTKQESGMVSSFDGRSWRPADDPQPGVHDGSGGGSYWPAFGDALYEKYKVPVGIASVGHSGTSVNQWNPGGELYRWMMTRVRQLGPHGFRGLQWHQGESDVGMPADEYFRKMAALVRASHRDAGWDFPWFVARVSYHNPEHTSFPNTRAAQKRLWDEGVAQEGPDTDLLTGDNRDAGGRGIHFSPKGLRAHGRMWADKVAVYIDRVLDQQK
jgi:serine/threonine protein kinase